MPTNPYATTPTGDAPSEHPYQQFTAYAAPSLDAGSPFVDSPAGQWAVALRESTTGLPDPHRLGDIPLYDDRPNPAHPPDEFYQRIDRDREIRYAGEHQDGVPWTEQKGILPGEQRFAPNPRSFTSAEPRPTLALTPASYGYVRPFDQLNRPFLDGYAGTARHLNGQHFSMADHRRTAEASARSAGASPSRKPGSGSRNTYRLSPGPWDINIVDTPMPVNVGAPAMAGGGFQSPDLPPAGHRSWRL